MNVNYIYLSSSDKHSFWEADASISYIASIPRYRPPDIMIYDTSAENRVDQEKTRHSIERYSAQVNSSFTVSDPNSDRGAGQPEQ